MVTATAHDAARTSLEEQYAPLLTEQLDWGKLVNYGTNRADPVYGWFRFKEAFSRRLVQEIIADEWELPQGSMIFDPFAGCGTTLLASYQAGLGAIGCDIMPIAVFITRVKLSYAALDVAEIENSVRQLLTEAPPPSESEWPDVKIVELAFTKDARRQIMAYRDAILCFADPLVRDFLMLGLLASLEEASSTSKDGQFLRLITRTPRVIRDALERNYGKMLGDLKAVSLLEEEREDTAPAQINLGDARSLPDEIEQFAGTASAIITSPPYLNRYDYSRTYALELCLMYDDDGDPFVREFDDLKSIRHSLLRSHIESRPAPTDLVDLPSLREVLANLEDKELNNARIPIMIEGYFEDMNLAIGNMARMLAPGGRVALVVANARFEGELLPVDLMLCELARSHGLETDEVRVTRYKGNSSQQMGKYGKVPVRETVSFWRKPA